MEKDIMSIESKFLTGILSKIITKKLQKQLGTPVEVSVEKLSIKNEDGKTIARAEVSGELYNNDLTNFLKNIGAL